MKRISRVLVLITLITTLSFSTRTARTATQTVRTATYVIAANDAASHVKAQADYVCDGTGDNIEIQSAIDALPSVGGSVYLSEGTFYITDTLVITRNHVAILGNAGGNIGNPKIVLMEDVPLLQIGSISPAVRAGNIGISDIYWHANHKDTAVLWDFQRFNDVIVSRSWLWGSDGDITDTIKIGDGWTLRFVDCPIEGEGRITGGDHSVIFRGCNIRVPINSNAIFETCTLHTYVTANPMIVDSDITATSGEIAFDNVNSLVLTNNVIDAHAATKLFRFASGANRLTFVANTMEDTLPSTIFSWSDPYSRTVDLMFANNRGINPFRFELVTNSSGQVQPTFPNEMSLSPKPRLIINVEGDYYAYVVSWTNVYGYKKDPVIQLKDSAGITATSGVGVVVEVLP